MNIHVYTKHAGSLLLSVLLGVAISHSSGLAASESATTAETGRTPRPLVDLAMRYQPGATSADAARAVAEAEENGIRTLPPIPRTGDSYSAPAETITMDAQEKKERLRSLETQASGFFRQQNFGAALAALRRASNLDESLAPPDMILANWFADVGLSRGVSMQLEMAAENSPEDPEAFIHLSATAVNERRFTEASMLLARAQELLEKYEQSADRKERLDTLLLGSIAGYSEAKEDWESLLSVLQSLEQKKPDDASMKRRIAAVFMKQKDEKSARVMLERACEKDTTLASPDAILAQIYHQAGDSEKALARLRTALTKSPENPKNQEIAIGIFFQEGKMDDAVRAQDTLLRLTPESATAHILSGDLLLANEKVPEAIQEYAAAIGRDPTNLNAGMGYVRALLLSGEPRNLEKSLAITSQTAEKIPNEVGVLLYHAWALHAAGRDDESLRIIGQVLPVWTMDPDEAYIIALCTMGGENSSIATRLAEESLKTPKPFILRPWMEKLQRQLGVVILPETTTQTPAGAATPAAPKRTERVPMNATPETQPEPLPGTLPGAPAPVVIPKPDVPDQVGPTPVEPEPMSLPGLPSLTAVREKMNEKAVAGDTKDAVATRVGSIDPLSSKR